MVLVTGLEPVRCCHRGILSPLRLPISPNQRKFRLLWYHRKSGDVNRSSDVPTQEDCRGPGKGSGGIS